MLTWLASYPKSGSTWVRAFLAAYQSFESGVSEFDLKHVPRCSNSDSRAALYTLVCGKAFELLSDLEIDAARGQVQHRLAATSDAKHVVKTHNARVMRNGFPLIDRTATARAVYVVRNPLDIVDSMADHAALSIDNAIDLLANRRHQLGRNQEAAPQFIDSWSEHVKSWTQHQAFPVLVLRYEEMLNNGTASFSTLIHFLQWELDSKRLSWAMDQTRFDALKRKEGKNGFAEVSPLAKSGAFFRHGQSQRWPTVLARAQAERVINVHASTMRIIGYEIPDLDQVYASPRSDTDSSLVPIQKISNTVPIQTLQAAQDSKVGSSGHGSKEKHLFIPAEWKRWIAENLLQGSKPDELVRILIEKGYPEPLSRLEVDVADTHPYLIAARLCLKRGVMGEKQ